jgi:NAD(P)-dependent dehydrogenase (short-subunit alcohol dehydrogenase family)
MDNLRDKVCVITGATSGIGRALALALARQGMRLFLIGRDQGRGRRLLRTIQSESTSARAEFLPCELTDLAQVRATAATIRAAAPEGIHLLVNNAHVRLDTLQTTASGIELTFAVNHLAHFALTAHLLESLLKVPEARILNVAGDAYLWGNPNWAECLHPTSSAPHKALATSKLANVIFTVELARRLQGTSVTVNAAHPGIVATRAGTNGQFWRLLKYYLYYGLRRELISARRAAEPLADLCTSARWRGDTGGYFSGGQPQELSPAARNPAIAAHLWDISLQLTQLGPELGPAWQYFDS